MLEAWNPGNLPGFGSDWPRSELINAALLYIIGFVVFLPLEKLFQKNKQSIFRKEYGQDALFFLGQYMIWNGLVTGVLVALHVWVQTLPLHTLQAWVHARPLWLQIPLAILLADFCIYWGHRLSHKIDFLWRFHRVHHTAERLDWLAAYREHPLDNLYTRVIENTPLLILGFPLESVAGFFVFRGLWGLYIHSNVDLSVKYLKYFVGSPELHHWHHELKRSGECNFANVMPVMDLLFGTFYDPDDQQPRSYGIPDKLNHNYFVQMIAPLLPDRWQKRLGWME